MAGNYEINSIAHSTGLNLNISETNNALELAREVQIILENLNDFTPPC